jgi:AcrR family transcriptional regulator
MATKKKTRRRLSAPERRAKVLVAALCTFADLGFEAASMNSIAAAAGVTKPVLYDYFPSKEDLFVAVLESVRDDLLARGAAIARRHDSHAQRFRAGVESFFRFADEHPDAIRVLVVVPRSNAAAAELSRKVQAGALEGIASLLEAYWQPDERWRLSAAAEFIRAGMHALAEHRIEGGQGTRSDLVDLVMLLIWQGLSASGKSPGRMRRGSEADG